MVTNNFTCFRKMMKGGVKVAQRFVKSDTCDGAGTSGDGKRFRSFRSNRPCVN